jgi:DNA-binding transcriptional regulator YiaG
MMEEIRELKELREKCNIPRSEIAQQLRCGEFTIFRWEHGRAVPAPYYKRELQKLLKKLKKEKEDE